MYRHQSKAQLRPSTLPECDLTEDTHTLCSDLTLEICKNQKRSQRIRKNANSRVARRKQRNSRDVSILTDKQKSKYIKQKNRLNNWSKATRLKNREERLKRDNRSTVNLYKKGKKRKRAKRPAQQEKCYSERQVIELNNSGSVDSNVTNSKESILELSDSRADTLSKNKKKFMQSNITLWKLGLTWSSKLEDLQSKNDLLRKDLEQKNEQIEEIFDVVEMKSKKWKPVSIKSVINKSKLKHSVVCGLCKKQIGKDDMAGVASCGHCYHLGCAVVWFKKDDQCPVCSHNVFKGPKGAKGRRSRNVHVDPVKMIELID